MRTTGKHMIVGLRKRWQLFIVLEVLLYGLSAALLIFTLTKHLNIALGCFFIVVLVLLIFKKPWKFSLEKTSQFLDETLISMENSTGLFLLSEENLSNLAVLQRHKITEQLKSNIDKVQPDVPLKKAFLMFLGFGLIAFLINSFDLFKKNRGDNFDSTSKETIVFQPLDSTVAKNVSPVIVKQELRIVYPSYTKLSSRTTSNMNIKAIADAQTRWNIQFDKEVDSVFIEMKSVVYPMKWNGENYAKTMKLTESGFYNFKFIDTDGASYSTDLYAIEVIKDEAPEIEIQNLKQFSTFDIGDSKSLKFNVLISDDFGINETYIIATVTKGEGESVKFREERLVFENGFNKGNKNMNLTKTIDLDALQMEAGDELYFYVEGIDVKRPKPNRTRSETYFAVIRDTISTQFAVVGTMGADLMPDYFRSQRQLIIDTEKLIADKNKLSKIEFNSTSNELGYDQKSLRLKYGEFMGDEADSGIQVTQEVEIEEEQSEDDPLQEYTHDHDGNNEHNLVDHEHEDESEENTEDALEAYLHNHDDPEESTLFTQSLKGKLRQAMSEMWDAELHLRLYNPQKSLPYQFRALKLIQEIKNSARIYVHRIGFDPPPIKEDKRLTGEIQDVKTFQKAENISRPDDFKAMRKSVTRISEIVAKKSKLNMTDKKLFGSAANELAALAIKRPSNYLNTLQRLKWLSEREQTTEADLLEVQLGLLSALPTKSVNPYKGSSFENEINILMLKELQSND